MSSVVVVERCFVASVPGLELVPGQSNIRLGGIGGGYGCLVYYAFFQAFTFECHTAKSCYIVLIV